MNARVKPQAWHANAVAALCSAQHVDRESCGFYVYAAHRCHLLSVCSGGGAIGFVRLWRDVELGKRTHASLERLQKEGADPWLPRPIHCESVGARLVTAETAVPGQGWTVGEFDDIAERRVRSLADWFVRRGRTATDLDVSATETFDVFAGRLKRLAPDGPELKELDELRQRLTGKLARVGIVHHDLTLPNLLTTDAEVTGIIDWEHACTGPLLLDWCSFALTAYQAYRSISATAAADSLRTASDAVARELARQTDRIVEAHSTDSDVVDAIWDLARFRARGGLLPKAG